MTPPKGYRIATDADLREGVDVLIPATLDDVGDAGVKHPRYPRQWIGSDLLPGLALIRDEAGPSEEPTSPADYAIRGRALALIREALEDEDWEGDEITVAYRVVDILFRGRGTEAGLRAKVRTLDADLATALRERDEARAAVTGEDVAALTERAEQAEEQVRGLRAECARLEALAGYRRIEADRLRTDAFALAGLRASIVAARKEAARRHGCCAGHIEEGTAMEHLSRLVSMVGGEPARGGGR